MHKIVKKTLTIVIYKNIKITFSPISLVKLGHTSPIRSAKYSYISFLKSIVLTALVDNSNNY